MTLRTGDFTSLSQDWTLRALNADAVPTELREQLSAGIAASVPGEATLDLLNAGLIDNPFDANNEAALAWIGNVEWAMTCQFEWSADAESQSHERHDLVASGVDTIAALRLNGQLVGSTENFHRTYRWDVVPLLRQGNNTLEVTFASADREAKRREQEFGFYPHTEKHAFNQIRKPASQFGWDWGIDVANAGITGSIGVESWSGARIEAVRPLVNVRPDGTGELTVSVDIERSAGRYIPREANNFDVYRDDPVDMTVRVGRGDFAQDAQLRVEAGKSNAAAVLEVPNAELWWPRGYGNAPLYDIEVSTGSVAGSSSQWSGRVGFRTVSVDTAADEVGRPFQLIVNGVKVHARGYNWIPDDAYVARVKKSNITAAFKDLVESNSNMVRVWGGGLYESEEFYDAADEAGMMVWQDFAFACAAYREDSAMVAEVEAEAREQISRLSSHPSLVVWNGSNENIVAYADWKGFKQALRDDDLEPNENGYGERGWGDYYYSHLLPGLLKELDSTRVYLPSSPMSFSKYTDPNTDVDGTMHIWDVWNSVDYRKFLDYIPRFVDEFGYQAPPAWSTLTSVVHDEATPFSEQMLVHQKASDGNIKLARGMRSHLTPGSFDDVDVSATGDAHWLVPSDDWGSTEDWHWACQLQQAQAIAFGLGHMRSLEPLNAGALIWQLNDDWPVISWAAVDYDGHRKPLWFTSRDCFAPRFATIQPRVSQQQRDAYSWNGSPVAADALALVVVNDSMHSWSGTWVVERMTLSGEVLASSVVEMAVSAVSQQTVVLDEKLSSFADRANEILVASPQSEQAQGSGDFQRAIYNPADVIDQNLTHTPMSATVTTTATGYLLTLTAETYVRDAFCMVDKVNPDASIDGGMVSLLPRESVEWNITSAKVENPEAFIAANVLRCANDLKC